MTRSLTVGIGAASLTRTDAVLELGPHHPTAHGAWRLALEVDGDVVVAADPRVGLLHRGAEKLFEVRDYRQVVVLANRHDWLSAFGNELGVVLAVERMMGLTVPPRAVWLRTLLAELNRIASHLVFLGVLPLEETGTALQPDVWALREAVQDVLEEATGGRVHFMANRVGGLLQDVPEGWTGRVAAAVRVVRDGLGPLEELVEGPLADRVRGVGVLPVEAVPSYGVSGPVARASGWDVDLRRDDPYLAYAELDVPVVLGTTGDTLDRYRCLLGQVRVSLDLVLACLAALPDGAVDVRLPKTVKAPEGHTWVATENPLGTMGWLLVSRGERTPWRLAMRTASYGNTAALAALLPGVRLGDLVAVLASMCVVVGDVDK